jgi:hypothetical protein
MYVAAREGPLGSQCVRSGLKHFGTWSSQGMKGRLKQLRAYASIDDAAGAASDSTLLDSEESDVRSALC